MTKIVPEKLKSGDEVRIVAPSRGLKIIGEDSRKIASERFKAWGLKVSFGRHTTDDNWNMLGTSSIEDRVEDIMDVFQDKKVKGIFTIIGGFNSNQLLPHLDYEVIRQNPKIFCGFSDITALLNAIYAQTGLVTFSGPHYSSLGMLKGCEYTIENAQKMLMGDGKNNIVPSEKWSDDPWFIDQQNRNFIPNDGHWVIHAGQAEGKILGGNLGTFDLLLGTPYRPAFEADTILFVEDTGGSDIYTFDRNLQALLYQEDFKNVKALLIGRFQKDSKISREMLEFMINSKPELKNMPVIANLDFGHTTPLLTLPIGGSAKITGSDIKIQI